MTCKLLFGHADEGEISLVKLDVDSNDIVHASFDKVGDNDIGLVRGAKVLASRDHKLESLLVRKLERKSKQGGSLLTGMMAILNDLAVELAVHVDALVNVRAIKVETSHVLPENFVEAGLTVINVAVDTV